MRSRCFIAIYSAYFLHFFLAWWPSRQEMVRGKEVANKKPVGDGGSVPAVYFSDRRPSVYLHLPIAFLRSARFLTIPVRPSDAFSSFFFLCTFFILFFSHDSWDTHNCFRLVKRWSDATTIYTHLTTYNRTRDIFRLCKICFSLHPLETFLLLYFSHSVVNKIFIHRRKRTGLTTPVDYRRTVPIFFFCSLAPLVLIQ